MAREGSVKVTDKRLRPLNPIILVVLCWPAALIYYFTRSTVIRYQSAPQQYNQPNQNYTPPAIARNVEQHWQKTCVFVQNAAKNEYTKNSI